MNRIKGSYTYKAILHGMLFILGLILSVSAFHVFAYLNSYSTTIKDVTETPLFQSRYLKYVERLAIYINYREKGYTSTFSTDYPLEDLENLFKEDSVLIETPSTSNSKQDEFNYYNSVLNISNWNFQYYVKNINTGAIYASKELESLVREHQQTGNQEEVLNTYLKDSQENKAYLIINTDTKKYATNVNRKHQYLNDENIDWVINYMTNTIGETLTTDKRATPNYIICTTIADRGYLLSQGLIPDYMDEFEYMFQTFDKLNSRYQTSIIVLPVSFILLLIVLSLAVAACGYNNKYSGLHLNSFDKLKTETGFFLSATGIFFILILSSFITRFLRYELYELDIDDYIIYIITYTLLYPICILSFTSLVRRIKSHTLLNNSLFFSIFSKIRNGISAFFSQQPLTYPLTALLLVFIGMEGGAIYLYLNPLFYIRDLKILGVILAIIGFLFLAYFLFRSAINFSIITKQTKGLTEGNVATKIDTSNMCSPARTLGDYINNIGDGLSAALDEKLKSERLKTELIANVSHDIKTPLTSIINYVDLLKKENLNNEKAQSYLEILSQKSWRLKTLIEDLVEASKASSGTVNLNLECLNLVELVKQSLGEFEDRFVDHNIEPVLNINEEPIYILADGRSTYRMIENIFSNVNKYALGGTRVYIDITAYESFVVVSVKNISSTKLNINADELMERFVRGDLSRNTEGSGLGLSITRSLANLQNATFDIILDGDLFKTVVKFNRLVNSEQEENGNIS